MQHIAANCILERMQFNVHPMPVSQVHQGSAGVERATPSDRRKSAIRACPACCGIESAAHFVTGLKHCGPSGEYHDARAGSGTECEQLLDRSTHRQMHRFHARNRLSNPGRVPHLKRAEFPVETGTHGAVDGGRIVRRFSNAIRGIVPERGQEWPRNSLPCPWQGHSPTAVSAAPAP